MTQINNDILFPIGLSVFFLGIALAVFMFVNPISSNLSLYSPTAVEPVSIGSFDDETSAPFITVQQNATNNANENLSSDIIVLQQEVIRLRNQLEPRNISQAFLPFQPHSINQSGGNPYEEAIEGTIAGLGNNSIIITRPVPVK